jgi:cysteine-rich repeat protein
MRTKMKSRKQRIPISTFAAAFGFLCGILPLGSTPVIAQVGSWTTGSITTNGDTNNFVSVTTDGAGNFHGAWRPDSGSTGLIGIGFWNGTSWTTVSNFNTSSDNPDIIDSLSDEVSLAVDSVGDYHVAFLASRGDGVTSTRGVFYAKYDVSAGTWSFEQVQAGSDPNGWHNWYDPLVDVDSSNLPHMTFQFSDANTPRPEAIRYASRSGGGVWTISDVDNTDCSTGDCFELGNFGFALDGANKAHLVYGKERGDVYDADLMYATNAGGSFVSTVLKDVGDGEVTGPGVGDADIELDASDKVHISYSVGDFSASSVQYITNASGSFVDVPARGSGNYGSPNRIGIDGAANLKVIAYEEYSGGGTVRAATKKGSDAWEDEPVWANANDDFGTGDFMDAIMNGNGEIMVLFHRNSDNTGNDRRVMYAYGTLGTAICGNGTVESGEACDDGNTNDDDCCSSSCTFESSGSNCGGAATACSGQDTCDGAGTCQANHFLAGTSCGDAGTACIVQDTCDGAGSCTDNGFVDAGSNCGDGPTQCSGQDTCDGAGTCQANHFLAGTSCGDAGTACVIQDTCDGSGVCTDSGFFAAGTPCGNGSETTCDHADACDGFGVCDENLADDDTLCDDGDACSTVDSCVSGSCAGGPDTTLPTLDCSGIDPGRSSDIDLCSLTMLGTGFDPSFSDNCTGVSISNSFNSSSSLSGSTFDVGITPVTWTATDSSDNTASCSIDITIADDQDPEITCPEDIEAEPVSTSGAPVSFDDPEISDNCPDPTLACAPESESDFEIGDTGVSCLSTDDSGNQSSCAFTVTVLDAAGVIDNLDDAVTALNDDGALNGGQAGSLLTQLDHAASKLDRGQVRVACNTLRAFINHMTGLINTDGVLTEADGLPLIDSAENARAALGCSP